MPNLKLGGITALSESGGVVTLPAEVIGGTGLTTTSVNAANITAGVLPADVTGGSGLTALGTVTSANLSNTSIVYPAGHLNSITSIVTTGQGNINFGTSWGNVNTSYYKWDLPAAGTYLIGGIYRARQWTTNGFCKCRLYDNTNSTAIGYSDRMMLEQQNGIALNVCTSPIWKHTAAGAVTLYLQGYASASGNSGIQNDTNGYNECWHVRLY